MLTYPCGQSFIVSCLFRYDIILTDWIFVATPQDSSCSSGTINSIFHSYPVNKYTIWAPWLSVNKSIFYIECICKTMTWEKCKELTKQYCTKTECSLIVELLNTGHTLFSSILFSNIVKSWEKIYPIIYLSVLRIFLWIEIQRLNFSDNAYLLFSWFCMRLLFCYYLITIMTGKNKIKHWNLNDSFWLHSQKKWVVRAKPEYHGQ